VTAPFVSYPGRIWGVCWQALAWLNTQLTATPSAQALEVPVTAVFQTLHNGLTVLAAWQTAAVLATEAQALIGVENLPLSLPIDQQNALTSRAAGVAAVASGVAALALPINLFGIAGTLAAGKPAIPDPLYLEWCMTFVGEPAPVGAFLPSGADAIAQAWLGIANAIAVFQGSNTTAAYDSAARQYRASAEIASMLDQLQSGPFIATPPRAFVDDQGNPLMDDQGNIFVDSAGGTSDQIWNSVVALPTIFLVAKSLASAPALLSSQQASVIRYVLSSQMIKLAVLLLSFRSRNISSPVIAVLRNNESLMDLAARTGGDFENWSNIAALNNLQPPWPGASNTRLALSGAPLFISGTNVNSTKQPTYEANVLGTDWDMGGINEPQPPWLGDISLITGLLNFRRAIGRRLQTPLGSLIYHTNYGCSIPPEVGNIQSQDEAARLTAYGRAAINGDPRTGAILSASTTLEPGFEANFSATISPVGPGSTQVSLSEVLGANP
jgi:hypothetical protein